MYGPDWKIAFLPSRQTLQGKSRIWPITYFWIFRCSIGVWGHLNPFKCIWSRLNKCPFCDQGNFKEFRDIEILYWFVCGLLCASCWIDKTFTAWFCQYQIIVHRSLNFSALMTSLEPFTNVIAARTSSSTRVAVSMQVYKPFSLRGFNPSL